MAQNIRAPRLPLNDGIVSLPGMTSFDSGTAPLSSAKDGYVPVLDCSFTPIGSLSQFWVLTAAVAHYGGARLVPLPIPLSVALQHRGPDEVALTVLAFSGTSQPRALLTNPDYATNPGWHKLGASIRGGNVLRVDSASNDGSDEFIVQFAKGNEWIDLSILGAHLTLEDARHVAGLVGTQ